MLIRKLTYYSPHSFLLHQISLPNPSYDTIIKCSAEGKKKRVYLPIQEGVRKSLPA